MRKMHLILTLVALLSTQTIFANKGDDSSACGMIAKACKTAGYAKSSDDQDKKFWKGCMKPVILGQSVKGVNIDPATVKTCRADKIKKMQEEIQEFQKASSK